MTVQRACGCVKSNTGTCTPRTRNCAEKRLLHWKGLCFLCPGLDHQGSFSTRTLKWTGRVPDIVHAAPNRRTGAVEMGDRVVGGEEEYDSNWSSDLGLDSKPTVTSRPHGEVSFASMREKFSGMAESQAQTGHEIQTLSMTEQDPTSDSLSPLSLLAFPHFNRRRIPKLVRPLRSELAILSSSAFLPSSCRGQVQYKYGIMHDFQDRDVTQASVQDTAQQVFILNVPHSLTPQLAMSDTPPFLCDAPCAFPWSCFLAFAPFRLAVFWFFIFF